MLLSERYETRRRTSPRRFIAVRLMLATAVGIVASLGITACSPDRISGLTKVDEVAHFQGDLIWCVAGGYYSDSITCSGGVECTAISSFAGGGGWACQNGCTITSSNYFDCPGDGGGGGGSTGTYGFGGGGGGSSAVCPALNPNCHLELRPQDRDSLEAGLQHVNGDPICVESKNKALELMGRNRVFRGNPQYEEHPNTHGAQTIHGVYEREAVHIDQNRFDSLDSRSVATLLLHEALHTIRDDHHAGVSQPPYPGDYGHITTCIPPNS